MVPVGPVAMSLPSYCTFKNILKWRADSWLHTEINDKMTTKDLPLGLVCSTEPKSARSSWKITAFCRCQSSGNRVAIRHQKLCPARCRACSQDDDDEYLRGTRLVRCTRRWITSREDYKLHMAASFSVGWSGCRPSGQRFRKKGFHECPRFYGTCRKMDTILGYFTIS